MNFMAYNRNKLCSLFLVVPFSDTAASAEVVRLNDRLHKEYERTANPKSNPLNQVRNTKLIEFVDHKLNEHRNLQKNWDGSGALPINPDVLDAASDLIHNLQIPVERLPLVSPIASGLLQLEWHLGEISLELEFENKDTIRYLKWNPENSVEDEDDILLSDVGEIGKLIQWFLSSTGLK